MNAACTDLASRPRELLDERSATTLLAAGRPLVFARARSDLAAYAHDFATVEAIEVDRSGEYIEYLLLYRWSTVDRRLSAPPLATPAPLQLIAGDRLFELHPEDQLPVSLEHHRLLNVPAHAATIVTAYRIEPALLRTVADSHELTLRMVGDRLDAPFLLRERGNRALRNFAERAASP